MITFASIFGQDGAIDTLRRAYVADRLPHGLVFAGPAGVGKRLTADALGALFLCEKPREAEACGKCDSCRVYAAGNHPDYHYIYRLLVRLDDEKKKGRDLTIDVVRQYLLEPAGRKPGMNRGKVFIIEESELMTTEAQNAMLKTLEEPAGRTLIVLLTDQPDALLPTIRSRCQLVRFAPLPPKTVADELTRRGTATADATEAAGLSEGSLGLALRWLEDGVIPRAADLRQRLDRLVTGGAAGDLPDWLKSAAEAYAEKQIERDKLTSKDQATREGIALYLRLASQHFRRGRAADDDDDADRMDRLCSGIEAIAAAEQFLDANVTVSLIFQQIAVRLESIFRRPGVAQLT
jgi:DNA polymerase III subunit delta'